MYDLRRHYTAGPQNLRAHQQQRARPQRHRGYAGTRPATILDEEEDEEERITRQMQQQHGFQPHPHHAQKRRTRQAAEQPQQQQQGGGQSHGFFYSTFMDAQGRKFVMFPKVTFIVMMVALGAGAGMLGLDLRRLVHFLVQTATTFIKSVLS